MVVTVTAHFVTSYYPRLSAYDNNKPASGGSGAQEQLTWEVPAPGALLSEVGSGCPTVRAGPRLAEPHRRCSRTHLAGGRWFSAGGLSASRHGLSKRRSGCPHVTGMCPPERMIQASAVSACHDLVSEVTPPPFLQDRAGGTGRRVPSEGSTRAAVGGHRGGWLPPSHPGHTRHTSCPDRLWIFMSTTALLVAGVPPSYG